MSVFVPRGEQPARARGQLGRQLQPTATICHEHRPRCGRCGPRTRRRGAVSAALCAFDPLADERQRPLVAGHRRVLGAGACQQQLECPCLTRDRGRHAAFRSFVGDAHRGAVVHHQVDGLRPPRLIRDRESHAAGPDGVDQLRGDGQRRTRVKPDALAVERHEVEPDLDQLFERGHPLALPAHPRDVAVQPPPYRPGDQQPRDRGVVTGQLEVDVAERARFLREHHPRRCLGDRHARGSALAAEHDVVRDRVRMDGALRRQQVDEQPAGAVRISAREGPEHRRQPRAVGKAALGRRADHRCERLLGRHGRLGRCWWLSRGRWRWRG